MIPLFDREGGITIIVVKIPIFERHNTTLIGSTVYNPSANGSIHPTNS